MKKYFVGVVAILLAVGASAFRPAVKMMHIKTSETFFYNPLLGPSPSQTDPAYYQLGSVSCPAGTAIVCSIEADDNGSGKPVFAPGTDPVNNQALYSTTKRR